MPPAKSQWELLTTSQVAAFLCVTPSAVRHAARHHGIKPVGKRGHEHLWDARAFVDKVGPHDRRSEGQQNRPGRPPKRPH